MRTIEDIILEKNYSDLSVEELNLVSELADNEDEFNQMKQLFENMSMEFDGAELFAASSETKASLDQIFSAKHPVIANDWKKEEVPVAEEAKVVAFYNRNWVRVAAIFLLFIGVSVLFIKNSDELLDQKIVKQANNEAPVSKSKTTSTLESIATKPETAKVIYPNNDKTKLAEPVLALSEDLSDFATKEESSDGLSKSLNSKIVASSTSYLSVDNGFTANTYSFNASPSAPQTLSFTTSGNSFVNTSEKDKMSSSWGRLADLDPELNMSQPTTASAGLSTSVSKEGLAAEMLDWIQAAY